jgi:hypothetical protein
MALAQEPIGGLTPAADDLTTPQFVRAGLMRLEMGEGLTHLVRGGTEPPSLRRFATRHFCRRPILLSRTISMKFVSFVHW